MDASFLDQLQNQIPSVVVYFWKLVNKQTRNTQTKTYLDQFKTNEQKYKDWGIKVFFIVMLEERITESEALDMKRDQSIIGYVKTHIPTDVHWVYGYEHMSQVLKERTFRSKIEEASANFYNNLCKELYEEIREQQKTKQKYVQEMMLGNSIMYAYLQHQKFVVSGAKISGADEARKAYIDCLEMARPLLDAHWKYYSNKISGQKVVTQDIHIACRIQELRYIIDVLTLQTLLLSKQQDSNRLTQSLLEHYNYISQYRVWGEALSYEEFKYRADYFRLCYEILRDLKADKGEAVEQKKHLAIQFFMNYVRCSEQQMTSFEGPGKQTYLNPKLDTEEQLLYVRSKQYYGNPTGLYPKPNDPGVMLAMNEISLKKRAYFEAKSALRWRMRYAIDEAIKFIGYEGYLRNSITALKVLKRKFLKEKEEPTMPASVSHLTSEELQNLWAWEDIYHSLRKTQEEETEEHPNAVFLEFERKLMSSKDSQLEEVNLIAARLQGLLAEPRYAHDFVNITIRTKAKSECIKTIFESNFGLYGSEAALLIELKIPGNLRAVWKSFSLFFNHPKYHDENISVVKSANNKVAEKGKAIIESDPSVDGSKIVTYVHKFKLGDLVENNTLFLQEVVLHIEFECGLKTNIKYESETRLSDEMIISLPPHTLDVDLKYEPVILNKEHAHMKLGFRLSDNIALDTDTKSEEELLSGQFQTLSLSFKVLGSNHNTSSRPKLYHYEVPTGPDDVNQLRKFNYNVESGIYDKICQLGESKESQDVNLVAYFETESDEMHVSGELEARYQYYFIGEEGQHSVVTVKGSRKFRVDLKVLKPFVCHTEYQLLNPLLREPYSKSSTSMHFLMHTGERAAVVSTIENRAFPIVVDQMQVRLKESTEKIPYLKVKDLGDFALEEIELKPSEHAKAQKYFIPLEPKDESSYFMLYVKWRRLDPKPKKIARKYSIDLSSPTLPVNDYLLEGSRANFELSRVTLDVKDSMIAGSTDLASSQDNDSSANLSDGSFNKLNQSGSEQARAQNQEEDNAENAPINTIQGFLRLPNELVIDLARVKISDSKIHIRCDAPEHVILNSLFDIKYTIQNLTADKLNLKLTLGSCSYIYLRGDTDLSLKLEPKSTYVHEVKALAAKIGLFELPTVKIVSKTTTAREELVNACYQRYILINPALTESPPRTQGATFDLA